MVESNWSFNYDRLKLGGKLYWKELKELKIELPHDPAVSLLSIFLRKTNTLIEKKKKKKVHPNVHWSIVYHRESMKLIKYPSVDK